jgi:cytochrome b561
MPSPIRHHGLVVVLHWFLAFLIIIDLAVGTTRLVHIPNGDPLKIAGLRFHMSEGIVILTLMLVRLGVRLRNPLPPAMPTGSALLDRAAWWSHRLLYAAVIAMALTGLAMGLEAHVPDVVLFGRGELPADFWIYELRHVHYALARLLWGLIALHLAGAACHTLIRRDGLLRRMWFGQRWPAGVLPAELHQQPRGMR